ncbi:MAG: flagellar basal body P-ring formation protein FlgA [Planctomycetes bacterium]|nr:flagellar basal body P-ring formation protein FlgA [Planctomycetota bacterium]
MKRQRIHGIHCLIPTMLLFVAAQRSGSAGPPSTAADRVVISLHPSSSANQPEVSIGEIARVDTANASLKQIIESLDIAAAPADGESTAITPRRIEFRLRLAGLDAHHVSIRGQQAIVKGHRNLTLQTSAQEFEMPTVRSTSHGQFVPSFHRPPVAQDSVVEESPEVLDTVEGTVVEAARRAVLAQLPWPEDELTFQLAQPISREAKLIALASITGCSACLRASGPPVGRVNVDVTVKSHGQSPLVVPVVLEVRHYENVVSTFRPIPRGKSIQREDLYVHRWDVTGSTDYCTKPEQLIGRVVNRALPAAQIIRDLDLDRTGDGQSQGLGGPVVIKPHDQVNMVVRNGGLSFTIKGEAMQQGRVGETINVQNLQSRKIVSGKVVTADEVEISL